MNPRERILALLLLGAVVVAGGALISYQFLLAPLRNRQAAADELNKQIAAKDQAVKDLQDKKAQVERWRALSLPGDVNKTWGDYQKYLNDLLAECGFAPGAVSVSSRPPETNTAGSKAKKQTFVKLTYELNGHGNLASIARLLERFYRTPLLHQIKSVDLLKPQTVRADQKADELDIKLKIEALVVEGAPKRDKLIDEQTLPLPTLAAKQRSYADIATRNIFAPPAPPAEVEVKDAPDNNVHIRLTDITRSGQDGPQGWLYDRLNKVNVRLRDEAGFNRFVLVADDDGTTVVRGSVVHIDNDNRELVFRVELADKENEDNRKRDKGRIYRADCKELCQMVEAKVIAEGDEDRVYWVSRDYWDNLHKQGVVRTELRNEGETFRFRWDLVRGKVLHRDEAEVFVLLDKKYCAYRAPDSRERPKSHEGFCLFHVGNSLLDALTTPLEPEKVDEMKGKSKSAGRN